LFNNTDSNTAIGAAPLLFNTTGGQNTVEGAAALLNHAEGNSNTATGAGALQNNASGNFNLANGGFALFSTRPAATTRRLVIARWIATTAVTPTRRSAR
jgi:hypothetical protein